MTVPEWLTAEPADPNEAWWRATWPVHALGLSVDLHTAQLLDGLADGQPIELEVAAETFYSWAKSLLRCGALAAKHEQLVQELVALGHPKCVATFVLTDGRVDLKRIEPVH